MNLGRVVAKRMIEGYRIIQARQAGEAVPIYGNFLEGKPQETSISHKRIREVQMAREKKEVSTSPLAVPTSVILEAAMSTAVEIPQLPQMKIESTEEIQKPSKPVFLTYPLIPQKPAKGEPIFAYTKIFWDNKNNRYFYELIEPPLTEKLKKIMSRTKELLEQRLDVDFSKLKKLEATKYLSEEIDEILKYFKFTLTETERKILKYYVERDFTGFGKLEPLMRDPNIEDISCDGLSIPIFIFHRNPNIGSVISNISFDDTDELDSYVVRLAQLCGKSISIAEPLLDGSLPDGSRLQATLATDIARRGSNLTIRKFTEEPLTPVHLLNYGTIDVKTLAFLWFVVDHGKSIIVSGGTASGKTSFLNVLSLFIRPEKKIISIEDTAELKLPHPHWIPSVARTPIATEGKTGEVDLFALLKESLRQRPDYIIVGEVRGREAYILFQQMATGHPSLATIHAENISKLVDRLTTPPISLPPGLIKTVDLVVFLAKMRYKGKFIRKVVEILELIDFDPKTNTPIVNQIYRWNPLDDKFEVTNKSVLLKRISELTGVNENEIKKEIEKRIAILEWMRIHNISDYRKVHEVFSTFYGDPQRLLALVEGEIR